MSWETWWWLQIPLNLWLAVLIVAIVWREL